MQPHSKKSRNPTQEICSSSVQHHLISQEFHVEILNDLFSLTRCNSTILILSTQPRIIIFFSDVFGQSSGRIDSRLIWTLYATPFICSISIICRHLFQSKVVTINLADQVLALAREDPIGYCQICSYFSSITMRCSNENFSDLVDIPQYPFVVSNLD